MIYNPHSHKESLKFMLYQDSAEDPTYGDNCILAITI